MIDHYHSLTTDKLQVAHTDKPVSSEEPEVVEAVPAPNSAAAATYYCRFVTMLSLLTIMGYVFTCMTGGENNFAPVILMLIMTPVLCVLYIIGLFCVENSNHNPLAYHLINLPAFGWPLAPLLFGALF